MPTPDELLPEVRRFTCALLNAGDAAGDFLSRATSGIPGAGPVTEGADALRARMIGAVCGGMPPDPREGDDYGSPPFEGGQCAEGYFLNSGFTFTGFNGDGNGGNSPILVDAFRIGPFTGITSVTNPNGIEDFFLQGPNYGPTDIRVYQRIPGVNGYSPYLTLSRASGQPDNCGSLPRGNPTFRFPIGPVDTRPRVEFEPPVVRGPGRGITIPFGWFDVDFNGKAELEINWNGDVNLNFEGEFDPTFDFGGEGGNQPPEGEDPPPPPVDERVLVGVIVRTTKITGEKTTGSVFGDGVPPDFYLPSCGSLVFAISIDGVNCWTQPTDLEVLTQWVPALGQVYPYDARVKSRPGYAATITKVYLAESILPSS